LAKTTGVDLWIGIKSTLVEEFKTVSAKDLDLIDLVDTEDEVVDIWINFTMNMI